MKTTQKQKVLQVLENNINKWLPAWHFVGVKQGVNGHVFLSYKAPARLSEIYKELGSDRIERRRDSGDGTHWYSYRLIKKVF